MMTPMRYVLLVLAIIISLHFILSFSHEGYGRATSFSHFTQQLSGSDSAGHHPPFEDGVPEDRYVIPSPPVQGRKANATFAILARNGDLNGIIFSMRHIEDRFNKQFQYPYVFLNEEPFSEEFMQRVQELTDAKVEFGLIPKEQWVQPPLIDEERAAEARKKMTQQNVIYGGSVPYRNMCRFNSGFFYRHPLLQQYRYYWRIEPDVTFFCDLHYDPFLFMEDEKKVYGFTVSLLEYPATIPTLWNSVKTFINSNPDLVEPENAMRFISDDGGETYNHCHFWSNFEIGDLDFWRGEAYSKFFDFLDEQGGFYYERWGDAPVHSLGVALFAKKEQIHFFNDIGYRHDPFQHCPQGELHKKGKCWCNPKENFDNEWYSCLKRWNAVF